jgi:hypothetical protein
MTDEQVLDLAAFVSRLFYAAFRLEDLIALTRSERYKHD